VISTLPQHDPVDLEYSPIALAIVQLRFPDILSIQTDEKLIAKYQEQVRRDYPYYYAGQQVELLLSPQGVVQQPAAANNWQFKDIEQNWTITLTVNSISLEAKNYTSVSEFAGRMEDVLLAAQEVFGIAVRNRVGLRYVNEIRHPKVEKPSDWRQLMNPTLLGLLSDNAISSNVESTLQELRLSIPNGSLIVRHGAAQGTTVAPDPQAPTPPNGEFYLFDLDAYDEGGVELNVDKLVELIKGYNRIIYSLFRWGIKDELFEYLKGDRND
jgi:uncharacterized protein (TIGR04255 family)